jgi:hypothetical protein
VAAQIKPEKGAEPAIRKSIAASGCAITSGTTRALPAAPHRQQENAVEEGNLVSADRRCGPSESCWGHGAGDTARGGNSPAPGFYRGIASDAVRMQLLPPQSK